MIVVTVFGSVWVHPESDKGFGSAGNRNGIFGDFLKVVSHLMWFLVQTPSPMLIHLKGIYEYMVFLGNSVLMEASHLGKV